MPQDSMANFTLDKIQTADGSQTLYCAEFSEHYHSITCGAFSESLKKHIIPTLAFLAQNFSQNSNIESSIESNLQNNAQNSTKPLKIVRVLDLCFGLGYNTLCLLFELSKIAQEPHNTTFSSQIQKLTKNIFWEIYAFEIDENLIAKIAQNSDFLPPFLNRAALYEICQNKIYHAQNACVRLFIGDARELLGNFIESENTDSIKSKKFDIVFHDPFSPKKCPQLWTFELFSKLFLATKESCILSTYSHSSAALLSAYLAGFFSYKINQGANMRDSIILTKSQKLPILDENLLKNAKISPQIKAINLEHKIATNPHLKALYEKDL